ncbi:MAG: hypothetical protein II131_01555, partial [Neisseriaceae bacterium]|nr:hypothetical protein [Neisseriaceae bacterium]
MGKLKYALAMIALCSASFINAAPEPSQKELDQIRQEIRATDKDMQAKKAQQDKLEAQIRATDKELNKQRAELAKVQGEKQVAVAELERLQQNAMTLETQIEGMKGQVARLIESRYRNRRPEAVIMLLQNKDPNEKGRQLEYLRKIQAANQTALTQLALQQEELKRQSELINEQMAKIQALIEQQRKIISGLEKQKKTQLASVAKLDNDISQNEKKIKALKNDEQQMASLIKRLAEQKATHKNEATDNQVTRQPENSTSFTRLQGSLPMPLIGIGKEPCSRVKTALHS